MKSIAFQAFGRSVSFLKTSNRDNRESCRSFSEFSLFSGLPEFPVAKMDGVGGFEPPDDRIKICCLAT